MEMSDFSLVSIITPIYNGAEYLEELIQSVILQDYPNIEHLVIDDGSQDDGATVAILNKYSHLRWWSRENKGQYATMNEGLLTAKGEVVCFVSADDIVSPGGVSSAIEFLNRFPNINGVFGLTNYIGKDGSHYPYPLPFRKAPLAFYPYFAHISHCSLYVSRLSLLENGLFFNPSFRYAGDYDWMVRIHKKHLQIGVIDRELSLVRVHENQASQMYFNASKIEISRVLNAQHVNRVFYFLLSSFYFLRVRIWKIVQAFRYDGIRGIIELYSRYRQHRRKLSNEDKKMGG